MTWPLPSLQSRLQWGGQVVYNWHWYYPLGGSWPHGMGFWWLCSHGQLTNRLSISVPVRGQRRTFALVSVAQAFPVCGSGPHSELVLESSNLVGACVLAPPRDHPSL